MDGKGRYLDNIFIERLWRSLKYECVYLHAFKNGFEVKAEIASWVIFYNHERPHSAHKGKPPNYAYELMKRKTHWQPQPELYNINPTGKAKSELRKYHFLFKHWGVAHPVD